MKTSTEINHIFAEKIVGWSDITYQCPWEKCVFGAGQLFGTIHGHKAPIPNYVESADACLPILFEWFNSGRGTFSISPINSEAAKSKAWCVDIVDNELNIGNGLIGGNLPLIIVSALLKAHGVDTGE